MSAISAIPVGARARAGAQRPFVALYGVVHRMSLAVHSTFTRPVAVTVPVVDTTRVPRHYPALRSSFIESAAMRREMGRL
ncbi:hypothetical protein ACQI4F_19635 [Mycolicibacterium vaccae]|uniref:hypothetical protein n=1 Tax=Mycolicibacterium vaccae TaxID=1810 RepID=UPI003CF6BD62